MKGEYDLPPMNRARSGFRGAMERRRLKETHARGYAILGYGEAWDEIIETLQNGRNGVYVPEIFLNTLVSSTRSLHELPSSAPIRIAVDVSFPSKLLFSVT